MAWPTRYLSSHRPLPGSLGWSSRHLIAEQPDWVVELADRRQHIRSGDQFGAFAQSGADNAESAYSSTSEVSMTQFDIKSYDEIPSQSNGAHEAKDGFPESASIVERQKGSVNDSKPLCDGQCWPENTSATPFSQPCRNQDIGVSEQQGYVYGPLDAGDVRLLKLLPGSGVEPIKGVLVHSGIPKIRPNPAIPRRDLDYPLTGYEALSYTWGPRDPVKTVHVAQVEGTSFLPLDVTPNLHLVLQRLRSHQIERTLWIDAICINQGDIQEKGQQVADMMRIYANADRVIVWLGEAADESDLAIRVIKQLDDRTFRRKLVRESHSRACLDRLARVQDALSNLYNRPWFSRVWIWQEVMVARELVVLCGGSESSWRPLKRAAKRLRSLAAIARKTFQGNLQTTTEARLEMIRLLQNRWIFGLTISRLSSERNSVYEMHAGGPLELLMVSSMLEATDDRDKVYAFLGVGRVSVRSTSNSAGQGQIPTSEESLQLLQSMGSTGTTADDILHPFIPINYSLTVSQVYQHFTKYMINKYRSFDILCLLNTFPNHDSLEEPTWMIDWRRGEEVVTDIMTHNWDYLSKTFCATGSSLAELQDPLAWGNLNASGVCIDKIEKLLGYTADVHSTTTAHEILLDVASTPEEYGAKVEEMLAEFHRLRPNVIRSYPTPPGADSEDRRCCKTRGGRVCLVPAWAEVDDLLWILLGGRLPFVLRWGYETSRHVHKESLREAVLEVIGPCFVPDFENDEMYKDILNGMEGASGTMEMKHITLV